MAAFAAWLTGQNDTGWQERLDADVDWLGQNDCPGMPLFECGAVFVWLRRTILV